MNRMLVATLFLAGMALAGCSEDSEVVVKKEAIHAKAATAIPVEDLAKRCPDIPVEILKSFAEDAAQHYQGYPKNQMEMIQEAVRAYRSISEPKKEEKPPEITDTLKAPKDSPTLIAAPAETTTPTARQDRTPTEDTGIPIDRLAKMYPNVPRDVLERTARKAAEILPGNYHLQAVSIEQNVKAYLGEK